MFLSNLSCQVEALQKNHWAIEHVETIMKRPEFAFLDDQDDIQAIKDIFYKAFPEYKKNDDPGTRETVNIEFAKLFLIGFVYSSFWHFNINMSVEELLFHACIGGLLCALAGRVGGAPKVTAESVLDSMIFKEMSLSYRVSSFLIIFLQMCQLWFSQHPLPSIVRNDGTAFNACLGILMDAVFAAVTLIHPLLKRSRLCAEKKRFEEELKTDPKLAKFIELFGICKTKLHWDSLKSKLIN